MMSVNRAARLVTPGQALQLVDLPSAEPGPGEVAVRVRACGLCGTDLHLAVVGDLPVACSPITLGHEAAGEIAAVGPDVKGWTVGDRVALFPSVTCGSCRFCHAGRESLCEASQVLGMVRDGALADRIVVPTRALIRIPDGIAFDIAAVVTDGVATPLHALRARGRLQAGESVGVFGCGGLGTHAIQLARLMGAGTVVAIDTDAEARSRALELGADLALDPTTQDVRRELRSSLGRRGLDLALEFVGLPATVELALKCLGTGGRVVVVGVGPGRPSLPVLAAFVGREQALLGSFGMDRADIVDLYALVAAGRLDLSRSVTATYPLDRVNDALGHLARKDGGVIRIVVTPGGELPS